MGWVHVIPDFKMKNKASCYLTGCQLQVNKGTGAVALSEIYDIINEISIWNKLKRCNGVESRIILKQKFFAFYNLVASL